MEMPAPSIDGCDALSAVGGLSPREPCFHRDEDSLRLRENFLRVIDAYLRHRHRYCPVGASYLGHADSLLCGQDTSIRHRATLLCLKATLLSAGAKIFRAAITPPSLWGTPASRSPSSIPLSVPASMRSLKLPR